MYYPLTFSGPRLIYFVSIIDKTKNLNAGLSRAIVGASSYIANNPVHPNIKVPSASRNYALRFQIVNRHDEAITLEAVVIDDQDV